MSECRILRRHSAGHIPRPEWYCDMCDIWFDCDDVPFACPVHAARAEGEKAGREEATKEYEALLEGCFIPLTIREIKQVKGTKEAGKVWYAQSQKFIAGLQERIAELEAKLRDQTTRRPAGE